MSILLGPSPVSCNRDHTSSALQDQRGLLVTVILPSLDADTMRAGQSSQCGSRNARPPQSLEGKQSGQDYGPAGKGRKVQGEASPKPRVIRYRSGTETILADFLCLAAPIGLLLFAIILVTKNGQEAEAASIEKWRNSGSVLSTLFPVLFAAVVGRLMTQAARCKLENGSSIGTLEQLLGSRTVGGVVVTHLYFTSWFAGYSSSGRVGATSFFNKEFHTTIRDGGIGQKGFYSGVNALYDSMILSPVTVKNHTMDVWGNVRIPFLTPLNSSVEDQWQSREPGSDMVYSSLVGLPVANIPSGSSIFEIESAYIKLDCGTLKTSNSTYAQGPKVLNSTWLRGVPGLSSGPPPPNGTFQGFHLGGNGSDYNGGAFTFGIDRFIDYNWLYAGSESGAKWRKEGVDKLLKMFENDTGIEVGPTTLMFEASISAGLRGRQPIFYGTTCDVRQNYITSRIRCSRQEEASQRNCSVIAQRPSRRYTMPGSLSTLNFPDLFNTVSKFWPAASGSGVAGAGLYDFTLLYLMDPALRRRVELYTLSSGTISLRLSQILNTYIQVTSMGNNELMFGSDGMDERYIQRADAKTESFVIIFFIPTVWAALCIASNLILLVAGAISVFFMHWAVGPEVLGYATTALRNNSLMDLPESATKTDGMELAVQLRRRRVRFGLVRDGAKEGTVIGISDENLAGRLRDAVAKK